MNLLSRLISGLFAVNLIIVSSMLLLGHTWNSGVISYTLRDSFPDNNDVMMMDVRTGIKLSLLEGIGDGDVTGRTPVWSPDGNILAFWTFENRRDVFVHQVQLTDYTIDNLTPGRDYFSLPVYGSNGHVLFATVPSFQQTPIYLVSDDDPDGSIVIDSSLTLPAFSPDGQQIAYVGRFSTPDDEDVTIEDGIDGNEIDIYLIDLNTDETINLTSDTPASGTPIWHPDGSAIFFLSPENGRRNLYQINLTGRDITRLDGQLRFGSTPVISPDGRYLAYTTTIRSGNQGDVELLLYDMITGDEQNLSQSPLYDIEPTWSPDGKILAFVTRRHGEQDEIYLITIESGKIRRLTYTARDEADISWRPR